MFGIQTSELVVIALVAILVFGPEKVPEFFHRAGKIISGLQRTADDVWTSLQTELNQAVEPVKQIGAEIDELGKQIVAGTEDQPAGGETETPAEEPPAPEDSDQPEPGEDQPRDTP